MQVVFLKMFKRRVIPKEFMLQLKEVFEAAPGGALAGYGSNWS